MTEHHPGSRALAWLARMGDELPELIVEDAAAWGAWLARRHATSDGVWLALAKRGGHPPTRLRYQEALEEALCYGWIDGQVRRRDADSYRQRFTPRRKRSAWSKRNVELAERLIGEGRMKPTGKAAVDQARSDGRWHAAYAGFCNDRDAGRSRGSARSRAEGGGNVRAPHQPEPLRNPLPTRHRKAAGHTLAPPYEVRRNAGARRNDLPTAASA